MPPVRNKTGKAATTAAQRQRAQTSRGRPSARQEEDSPTIMMEASVEIQEVSLASHITSTNILLYGPPGVGKTRLAGGAPNAVFLSTELEGAVSAKVAGSRARMWPAPSWEYAVAGVRKAEAELGADDWLIIDSGTNMQEMYMRWILEMEHAKNSSRDLDIPAIRNHQKYQNGFKRWYSKIVALRCNTIFICNSMIVEDAEGETRVIPLLLGKKGEISDYISAQAGIGLYYSVARESREADAVGPDIVRRVLAQPFPPWWAKDRYDCLGTSIDVPHGDTTAMAEMIAKIDRAKKKAVNDRTSRRGRAVRAVAS